MTFLHELARPVRFSTFKRNLERMDFLATIEEIECNGYEWERYRKYDLSKGIKGTIDEAREFCKYFYKIKVMAFKLENDRIQYIAESSEFGFNEIKIRVRGVFDEIFPPLSKKIKINGINAKKVEKLVDALEDYLSNLNVPIYVEPTKSMVKIVINDIFVLKVKQDNMVYNPELYPRCIDDILYNGFGKKDNFSYLALDKFHSR